MVRDLLWRGMLAGLIAACLSALFALAFVEPHIDRAIAFEHAHSVAAPHPGMAMPPAGEEELVSRTTQKTAGLFTALAMYGAAIGGLFALAFAYGYGRVGAVGPRTLALAMAALAFVVIVLVPAIKYPPTPPAVGHHETVRLRTAAFFAMIALSLTCAMVAGKLRPALLGRMTRFTATIAVALGYVLLAWLVSHALPVIDEVPGDFPASVLWDFRVTSLAAQLVLWLALGIGFGSLAEARLRRG
jgi:predicted cobalt transporter CbtA